MIISGDNSPRLFGFTSCDPEERQRSDEQRNLHVKIHLDDKRESGHVGRVGYQHIVNTI